MTFNSQVVKKTKDLVSMVSSSEVNKVFPVKILREGKELTLDTKITKRPQDLDNSEESQGEKSKATFRGMAVEDISPLYQNKFSTKEDLGVIVNYVEADSAADKSGVRAGDVITKVGAKLIKNRQDFISVVSKIKGSWLLKTNRGFIVVKEK